MTSAEEDANALPRSVAAVVRHAPQAELRRYPGGHVALFDGELGRRVMEDEVEWLGRPLGATPT